MGFISLINTTTLLSFGEILKEKIKWSFLMRLEKVI